MKWDNIRKDQVHLHSNKQNYKVCVSLGKILDIWKISYS